MKINKFIVLSILVFSAQCISLFSQKIVITGVNPANYPEITASFFCYDANGDMIHDIFNNQVVITDNGSERIVKYAWCSPLTKFSSILTIDVSFSMNSPLDSLDPKGKKRIDLARAGAKIWIDSLPSDRSECAITSFNYDTKINQYYTINKDSLKIAIDSATKTPKLGTNYNGAFLVDKLGTPGAMLLSRQAHFKPIVVFLTDGSHDYGIYGPVKVNEIIALATELNATVYCITLGMPMPEELKSISLSTNGSYYENIIDEESVKGAYLDILAKATALGTPVPCEAKWDTDCGGGSARIRIPYLGIPETDISYIIPDTLKPYMQFSLQRLSWVNKMQNDVIKKKIRLYARNNDLVIDKFWFLNSAFIVTDWGGNPPPLKIPKNSYRDLLIKYEPYNDSVNHSGYAIAQSNYCTYDSLSVTAGWIYSKGAFIGIADTNKTKRFSVPGLLCNTTGDTITIGAISVNGANYQDFTVVEPVTGYRMAGDTCIPVLIDFTPSDVGIRNAFIEFTVGNTIYTADISGAGAGRPHLLTLTSLDMGTLDCNTDYADSLISVINTGTEDLVIEDISLKQDSHGFEFFSKPTLPLTLGFKEECKLGIRFNPPSSGILSAELEFVSNSVNSNKITVPLTGKKDSVAYSVTNDQIDLGINCPETKLEGTIHLKNLGEKDLIISPTADSIYFNLGEYNLKTGSEVDISFHLNSRDYGVFTSKVELSDKDCGLSKTVLIKWEVDTPSVSSDEVILVCKPGETKDSVLTLKNTSPYLMRITKASVSNSLFEVIGGSYPVEIEPGESIIVKLRFKPVAEEHIDAVLVLEGSPCNYHQAIGLSGISDKPMAVIACPDTTGYKGQEIDIPVLFMNSYKFDKTNTKSVSFKLRIDSRVLEPIMEEMPGVSLKTDSDYYILEYNTVPVSSAGQDSAIALLKVKVKNTEILLSSLDVYDCYSEGGNIYYYEIDGLFKLLKATADISIDTSFAVEPGISLDIPIMLKNCRNISGFHGSLDLSLKMVSTILEPVGDTPRGIVNKSQRIIHLYSLPLTADTSYVLDTLHFRAMLGSSVSTEIEIIDPKPERGIIDFRISHGKFTLILDDNSRLYNPFPQTRFLLPYPNPTIGLTRIRFEAGESGYYKMYLKDPIGRTVLVFMEGNYELGVYETEFNASNYSAGMYFLFLESPSQIFTDRINIVR